MQVKEEAQQLALIFETVGAFKVKRKGGKGKQIFGTWVDSNATLKKFNLFVDLVDIDMFLQCYVSRSGWHNQGTTSKVFSLKTGWINQSATVYDHSDNHPWISPKFADHEQKTSKDGLFTIITNKILYLKENNSWGLFSPETVFQLVQSGSCIPAFHV